MMGALRTLSDRLLGRGSAALTVPPLDGALKPNNRLEDAAPGIPAGAPRALVVQGGRVLWAEGTQVMSDSGPVAETAGMITALAVMPDGQLAIAAEGQGIAIGGTVPPALAGLSCVTALACDASGALWIAVGSTVHPFADWSRDFLELRRSGRVLRWTPGSAPRVMADRLGFPNGLLPRADGMVVSEAWAKRLIRLDDSGRLTQLMEDLPGYPAGLAPSAGGGAWLALFAPRSPLLELVLREPAYRRAMMAEVDPEFWIAPALRSGYSFHEPMQGGALKSMGILKPWAPTRSSGLVVELDAGFVPLQSLHSRAGGQRHGITSVLETGGVLWAASTGGNEVLRLDPARGRG
ncbi:SMP-30/gluconolactonase/LRE family protein [Gemmobacter nectariphilus]|uniref:SMP-30/gluconolactonase/LRE family protein n=1 Tax=Gemmobacter nectariphilus TaxID=220343 RepID=UPI000487415B|nr:hypothetical protein [Gemmobacter nectariphilus]